MEIRVDYRNRFCYNIIGASWACIKGQWLIYGNCLLAVLKCAWRDKSRGEIVAVKIEGTIVPHFLWVADHGYTYEFSVVRDVLPPPFCFLWFEGYLRRHKNKKVSP